MNYLKNSAGIAGALAIGLSFIAILAVIFDAVVVASTASFIVLFPLVLLTLPAIRRFEKRMSVKVKIAVEDAEKAIAELGKTA